MDIPRRDSRLVVCAIDFGTTYSGYAFSFKNEPTKVITNQSWAASTKGLLSLKTSTCILLDPQENFAAFGFEAEDKYMDLAEDDKHRDWLFFKEFKMILYDNKKIRNDTLLTDIRGKRVYALTIFSDAINYMLMHFREAIRLQRGVINDEDIHYVLTVPAIWNDGAKQFMRQAAFFAGIPGDQLTLALEPEAASIWGQVMTADTNTNLSTSGVRYIIVDLGGGTADITAHERLEDGSLKELHRPSGGPWGGSFVNQQYLAFLEQTLGGEVMKRFISQETSDYMDLLRDFETKKRAITRRSDGKITFSLPLSLRDVCLAHGHASISVLAERSTFSSRISVTRDRLRVDASLVRSFFLPVLDGLLSHLTELLRHPKVQDIRTVLLVGGFGECPLVHDAIRERFPAMELIVPQDASLTVPKGAARFGHMRDIICCRKAKYAYGTNISETFNDELHPLEKKVVVYGKSWCNDLFSKFVDVGDDLLLGKEVKQRQRPLHVDQPKSIIKVFCSERDDTRFVDEPGCYLLGHIRVPLPKGDTKEDKGFTVRLLFWGTEIKVIVRMNKTGKEYTTIVDCM